MLICITNLDQIDLLWCKDRCSFPMRSDPSWGYILCPEAPGSSCTIWIAPSLPHRRIWGIAQGSGSWQLVLCPHLQELSWSLCWSWQLPSPPTSPLPASLPSSAFEMPPSGGGGGGVEGNCTQSAHEICCGTEVLAICFCSEDKSQPVSGLVENVQGSLVHGAVDPNRSPSPSTGVNSTPGTKQFSLSSGALHSIP